MSLPWICRRCNFKTKDFALYERHMERGHPSLPPQAFSVVTLVGGGLDGAVMRFERPEASYRVEYKDGDERGFELYQAGGGPNRGKMLFVGRFAYNSENGR